MRKNEMGLGSTETFRTFISYCSPTIMKLVGARAAEADA